ncbi:bacterio-opsin activator [Salinadaptatus halalkaliphilus]|uniref:Bacterio-opsin activator n=1 Tax=Salinadaptatus halalkaliphilus TaxID=2419781 RepID=A0A4V3VLB9_9EURY|nr:helix-turn-helix domain-containing protein [Salinadaptatus halalkaliphilus]THE65097.1 bacterio-opsin activator [Salinadaptatus halalkaliphilus]
MSLLAEFEAASPNLVLGPTLEAMPAVTIDLERQYAVDPEQPVAFCWVRCAEPPHFEATLTTDDTVDSFDRVGTTDEWALYRIHRSDSDVVGAYRQWVSVGGELLECRATDGRWAVEMRFPDRDAFTAYHAFLEDEDVEFELHRLADGDQARRVRNREFLTESQREALVLAHEHGFFDVPRNTTLATIADSLDISNQAVSERLRRGQGRLIDEYLL